MRKRLLSLLLAFVLVLGMLPMSASAEAVSLPVSDGSVDITDATVGQYTINTLSLYVQGTYASLAIDSATQDGNTINVVLAESVDSSAAIQAGFVGSGTGILGHAGNQCTLSEGSGTMSCGLKNTNAGQDLGTATYTINFSKVSSEPEPLPKLNAPSVRASGTTGVPVATQNTVTAMPDPDFSQIGIIMGCATSEMVVEISKTEDFAEVLETKEKLMSVVMGGGDGPIFEFTGLDAGTDYYLRAKVTTVDGYQDSDYSTVVKASTEAAPVACQHPETTTAYVQVEGTETHTVTVTCANADCGQQVGEATTGNCVDEDANGECDLCKGAIVVKTPIEIKGTPINVTDNVIDITDRQVYKFASSYYGNATAIEILDATVEEAYEDGTIIYVVLSPDTPGNATVKTKFQFTLSNCEASGGEASFPLSGGMCEGSQTVTVAYSSNRKGSVTYNLVFLTKELPKVVPSVLRETGSEEVYQYNDLTINLKDYFSDALAYYLVDGETETAIEGSKYSVNTDVAGEQTLVFAAENNIGRADETVTVTVNVKELVGAIQIGYATSNGSLDMVTFKDASGNYLEDVNISYDAAAKKIKVQLPQSFDSAGKVKAIFKLTQTNGLPFITTKTGTSGTTSGRADSNKFTEKDITLSGGKATFTFYYYNTTPAITNNKYETWTLSFETFNNVPAFAGEVATPVTAAVYAGEEYKVDLTGIYADQDGESLTYQVSIDDGTWTNFDGAVYTYTNNVAGEYVLKFRAYDGKDYSADIYTVNLTVNNSTATYDVHVTAPEGYAVKYYIVSQISGSAVTAGDELVPENGVLKVPGNVDTIVWTCDNAVCGTAKVSEGAEVAIKAVKFSGKTITDVVDEACSVKVTDPNGVVMTVPANGTALLAAGSGYTFAATSGISGWNGVTLSEQTVSDNATVEIEYTINGEKTVTAPKDAGVTVYYQAGNYKGVTQTPVYTTENEDGTVTYHYSCTGKVGSITASGYVYRATMDGKITKAGYLNAVNNVTLTWSEQDNTSSYRGADESPNYSTTDGLTQRRAGDNLVMTVNATGHLVLSETKDVGAFRNWAIINTDTENVAIEPDYHFNVINGDDVVTITDLGSGYGNNWQRLTKSGSGTAFVEVSFDAIHIVDGYEKGGWGGAYGHLSNYTYNASNPNTTGLIVVQTDGNAASDVTFNIASDRKAFTRQWDAEHDTYYILEDTGLLTLTPTASSGIQSVAVSNDKGATFTTLEAVDGAYTATVVPGNNIIRVTNANGQTAYQVVRALKLDLRIENQTDSTKGEEFAPGDTVRLYITGLISPVSKMGSVYNPQAVKGTFAGSDNITYNLTGPGGVTGSYAFNGRTYYIDNIVIPESGQLTLSGKYLSQTGFNLLLAAHRGITMAGTGGSASGSEGSSGASVLPVIVLGKEETKRPELTGEDTIEVSMRLNQWKEIDLSQYFADEDSETLTYYINEGQEWTELTGSTYLYYPAGDGVQTAKFTALDESMTLEDVDDTTPMLTLVADVAEVPSEVTVTFSVSQGVDKYYTTDEGKIMIPHEITVRYFDIGLYGLTDSYYNPRCYANYSKPGTVGGGTAGTKETAEGVVTPLHVFIWATEVYQLGYDPDQAGKGTSHNNGLEEYFAANQGAGSAFVNLWNGTNMNYYVNMEYPLGYPQTGSTCDQIALYDGDVISGHFIADEEVKGSSFAALVVDDGNGTYNLEDYVDTTVDKGDTITLTAYQSVADWVNYTTSYAPSANAKVTYVAADNLSANTSAWTEIGKTDSNGQIVIDTATMKAGTYYIAVQGAVDNEASKEREAAVFKLTVVGGEEEVIYGDADGNGAVQVADALLIRQKVVEMDVTLDEAASDVDGNGTVQVADALLIEQLVAEIITGFPAAQ